MGPRPIPTASQPAKSSLSPETKQSQFELGIWYTISLWPALSTAVANSWGGPDSSDKRDWLAGAISDLFTTHPDDATDADWLADFLSGEMDEEFEVVVDDDSNVEVAREIIRLRREIAEGDLRGVERVERMYRERRPAARVSVSAVDQDVDDDDDEEDEEDDADEDVMDVDVDEVPTLVSARERSKPEVDEDGFTKVPSRRKR
ncbi:rRNA accumulation-related protein [Elasticomyces elasticus]|nr:rRNA accumulation-related protein [Elasticomyces elasticus]